MAETLGPLKIARKDGTEEFRDGPTALGFDLLSFWRWSCSDLVNNTARGILAEYIVSRALGVTDGCRIEWDAYDVVSPDGVKIEVKSAAYLQSWDQKKLSSITFSAPKTLGWDSRTNEYDDEPKRQSDVYVFALLAHKDKATVDPTDVSQWQFFVVSTKVLNHLHPLQKSFGISSIRKMAEAVIYSGLRNAIQDAARASDMGSS